MVESGVKHYYPYPQRPSKFQTKFTMTQSIYKQQHNLHQSVKFITLHLS